MAVLVRLRSDRCFYADPHHGHPAQAAGRAAMAPRSPVLTRPPWPTPTATLTCQDDRYGTVTVQRGPDCIPGSNAIPATAPVGPPIVPGTIIRVQVERLPPGPADRRCCGCGGPAPANSIWTWPGAPPFAGSTWSTPSGSPSRPSAGPPRGRVIPSRPTDGPGWSWRLHPAAAGPRGHLRPAAAVRAAATPAATVTLAGAPWISAAAGHARLAGHHAKPSGRSPGRPKGQRSGAAARHPAIKKPTKQPRIKQTKAAKAA